MQTADRVVIAGFIVICLLTALTTVLAAVGALTLALTTLIFVASLAAFVVMCVAAFVEYLSR